MCAVIGNICNAWVLIELLEFSMYLVWYKPGQKVLVSAFASITFLKVPEFQYKWWCQYILYWLKIEYDKVDYLELLDSA